MKARVRRPDWLRAFVARSKPDHKAQAPSNNQSRQGQIDQPIGLETHHTIAPKIIKARITKGRDSNKDGVKDPHDPSQSEE